MATSLGDTYLGLAHTASQPVISGKQLRWLDARWREWEPFMVMAARRESSDPANRLYQFRALHRQRIIKLLRSGIRLGIIKKHRLDDPTNGDNRFEFLLAAAMERRRTRLGRIKGIKRTKV
jgi:hypothetical protein